MSRTYTVEIFELTEKVEKLKNELEKALDFIDNLDYNELSQKVLFEKQVDFFKQKG